MEHHGNLQIWFVRHGESEANVSRIYANTCCDGYPLTSNGYEQARSFAESLSGTRILGIYSSPLLRARQTAQMVGKATGASIQIAPELIEYHVGIYEGTSTLPGSAGAIADWEIKKRWYLHQDFDASLPGLAIPFGVACGLLVGLVNGIGVAYLRVPSMIFTLGTNVLAQGLMIVHTSGYAPQDRATPSMHWIAVGRSLLGVPNALVVWGLVALVLIILLRRTVFGRRVYAIGNRESAAYLSGIDTRRVILFCFAISGACSAFSGVLLAGYSTHAYQAMGDPYLLPAIAAVVLGGTRILGGRGTFLGTIAGVILITLLQSILSVIQMPEAGRQVIYGIVIIAMLLLYGRERAEQ